MKESLMLFQALADVTRLRILIIINEMELSVGELALVLGQSQPRVSRHLRIMTEAGLLRKRKEGNWVFVSLGDARYAGPALSAIDVWEEKTQGEPNNDVSRLDMIRATRADAANQWFDTHASQWDEIRALHVSDKRVEKEILNFLTDRPIGRLLDIGTGTGRMIALLRQKASRAVGIDRSPAMLRLARTKMPPSYSKVSWQQGDLNALSLGTRSFDTAIMHHVLHYAPHPAAAIAEAARVLDEDGQLLIVDFLTHGRNELRELYAHAWRGFSDEQMRKWLKSAGLIAKRSLCLQGEIDVMLWLAQKAHAEPVEQLSA